MIEPVTIPSCDPQCVCKHPRSQHSLYNDVQGAGMCCSRGCCECTEFEYPQDTNGFDYTNQAWVIRGVYESCGHPEAMKCGCFGRIHAGESPAANAEIH